MNTTYERVPLLRFIGTNIYIPLYILARAYIYTFTEVHKHVPLLRFIGTNAPGRWSNASLEGALTSRALASTTVGRRFQCEDFRLKVSGGV